MKLSYKKVFYVGLAFFLISLFWQTYDSIVPKILIDKFGLNQTWSGVVMAMDNILALFLLPLFGGLSDKTNSKRGRRTPYIIVGTIVAAFAFVGLSFSDNYQNTQILDHTTVIADYESAVTEKNIILGSVLSGSVTAKAKALAAGTITQTEYDDWHAEWLLAIAKWNATNLLLLNQKNQDRIDEVITTKQYDRWIAGAYADLSLAASTAIADGGITQAEYSVWFDEIYDGVYTTDLAANAWELTTSNPLNFIVFFFTLFIALIAMATFRSPAVALMPDVTMKPLRSKANAIINLMGTLAGILSIILLSVFALSKDTYVNDLPVNYSNAFIAVGALMLILLGIFLWKVKEPKLVAQKEADDIKYGLDDATTGEHSQSASQLEKGQRTSLYLIMFSVFLWFFGYNAVTTKLSDYAPKVLGMGYSMPLLIAQGAALIAFIPIGFLATKIGRRKTILIGITILTICFGCVYFINENTNSLMYIIFAFTGIGWATINVNSYPMVVELSKGSNVGKYTGYYYTASMSAQILTPIISGILMDQVAIRTLFPYATLFVGLAFVTMSLVKHGDAKIIDKKSTLEKIGVDIE